MNPVSDSGTNLLATLGIRLIEANADGAVATLDFRPELQQLTGLFHAGAILALADTAATYASMHVVDPAGAVLAERFPLSVQVSANLLSNVNEGTITAEARPIHRGRTMIVVETHVRDQSLRSIAVVTSTHLVRNG